MSKKGKKAPYPRRGFLYDLPRPSDKYDNGSTASWLAGVESFVVSDCSGRTFEVYGNKEGRKVLRALAMEIVEWCDWREANPTDYEPEYGDPTSPD